VAADSVRGAGRRARTSGEDPMHDDRWEDHFPITVLERRHPDVEELNAAVYAELEALEHAHAHDPARNAALSGRVTTRGGYQTARHVNLFELAKPALRRLHDEILRPAVRDYLARVFGEGVSKIEPWLMGWANVLRAGDWQAPHMHPTPGNLVASVYYVRLPRGRPEPEGWIEFLNPHPQAVYAGAALTRRIAPEAGKLVLFPPYYVHYVHPFRGEDPRAVVAFDVLSRRPALELSF
jgi:hypothetical protein